MTAGAAGPRGHADEPHPDRSRRGRFDGVVQIVRFNWPFYAVAAAAVPIALLLPRLWPGGLPAPLPLLARAGGVVALFYLAASLLVSHLVYDRSDLYRWRWLERALPDPPRTLTNVHAGFDETSAALAERYPDAELAALDFYDPARHTEPSIRRARAVCQPFPATARTATGALPLADGSQGAVFLLLAAHEIRDAGERRAFLREVARTLAPDGRVVLVEHLRNMANFLAFGPGFFHFFSRRQWLADARAAGLVPVAEEPITSFLRLFVLHAESAKGGFR